MEDEVIYTCPLMSKDCILTKCAWFKDGDCGIYSLNYLDDRLDKITTCIETLEQTIRDKDFT